LGAERQEARGLMNISTSPKAEPANGRAPDGIERNR
jgi:hypothetical protein